VEECKTDLTPADAKNVLAILNRISLLGGLSDEQLAVILSHLKQAVYKRGDFVFAQGDPPHYIFIVLSGRVRIVVDADTTPLELVECAVGQCFGETSVIGILPHSASAIAMEETQLLVLSMEALHTLYQEHLQIFAILVLNIAREACRRLHKADETFLYYAAGHKP